jgi:type I restriction enzyme S subunit
MYAFDRLGVIATVINGFAFKSTDFCSQGKYPIIKIKNIAESKINIDDCNYIQDISPEIVPYEIRYNDILISMTGSRPSQPNSAVGKIGRMRIKNVRCFLNQRVGKIVPLNQFECNQQYLYYVLNRKEINLLLASNASGSANQANISASQIKEIMIPQPPRVIQDKIVNVLTSLDEKIDSNEARIKLLAKTTQLIYQSWFSDFDYLGATGEMQDGIPAGWINSTVFENTKEIREKNKDNFDYPVLSVVKEGEFKLSDDVFTKQVYSKSTTNYKVIKRNQVGYNPARANIGSIAMLTDFDVGLVSPIYTVFEVMESITPTFFYYYMKQPMFVEGIKHHAIGTTRQNFPFEAFRMFAMVVPPIALQKRFEEITNPIEQKISKLKEENAVLAETRDTLLPKLISGELPV